MKRLLLGVLIGFIGAGILGIATLILAQERVTAEPAGESLIVLGGLKIKEGADLAGAEKLLKEQLIPSMEGIEGLKMKVLKRMKTPGEQVTDPNVYDYIMMAEFEKIQGFMQLMQKRDAGLNKFGDMMKEYAGHPYINAYVVIAKTKETE